MGTASEIEDAIRALPAAEREKLVEHLPDLLPELAGDLAWRRIANDSQPRPALTAMVNETAAAFAKNPDAFPKIDPKDFEKNR